MTAKTLLKRARKLIEDPSHWCTGAYAKAGRKHTAPRNTEATSWCAIGAIRAHVKVPAYYIETGPVVRLLDAAARSVDPTIHGIVELNDDRRIPRYKRHKLVLEAFDRAIEAAQP